MKNPRLTKPRLSTARARKAPTKEASLPDQTPSDAAVLLEESGPGTANADDAGIRHKSKADAVIAMLLRPQGASLTELMVKTGWQRHSVRGALSGAVKKRLGAPICSQVEGGERRYRAVVVCA